MYRDAFAYIVFKDYVSVWGNLCGIIYTDRALYIVNRSDDPWSFGPWCNLIAETIELPYGIPMVGGQSAFPIPDDVLCHLKCTLAATCSDGVFGALPAHVTQIGGCVNAPLLGYFAAHAYTYQQSAPKISLPFLGLVAETPQTWRVSNCRWPGFRKSWARLVESFAFSPADDLDQAAAGSVGAPVLASGVFVLETSTRPTLALPGSWGMDGSTKNRSGMTQIGHRTVAQEPLKRIGFVPTLCKTYIYIPRFVYCARCMNVVEHPHPHPQISNFRPQSLKFASKPW